MLVLAVKRGTGPAKVVPWATAALYFCVFRPTSRSQRISFVHR